MEPLVFQQKMNASSEKIWKAITRAEEMKHWYFELEEFRAEPGFTFTFIAGDAEKKFLHECTVKEVIPEKKLSYSWRYPEYSGNTLVTFQLFSEEGDKTLVKLTHEGLESLPDSPEFARKNFQGGWEYFIGKALKEYVED
ncbi:MAG: SRPBCC domain-containing protein [Gillisia sp.]